LDIRLLQNMKSADWLKAECLLFDLYIVSTDYRTSLNNVLVGGARRRRS
jgi:hypothetical protein